MEIEDNRKAQAIWKELVAHDPANVLWMDS